MTESTPAVETMDNDQQNPEAAQTPAPEAQPAPDAQVPQPPQVDDAQLKKALESLLFITDRPLTLEKLCKALGISIKKTEKVRGMIGELRADMEQRGSAVQVIEVADGFQMSTRPDYAPWVRKIFAERMTMRLSTAAHETLSIIAYKQPLTRAEIESIRGVEVIAALETLVEKRLIEVVGRKETVGRPLMYGTTHEFLRHFGLRSLEDLPPLDQFAPAEPTPGITDEAASEAAQPESNSGEAAEPQTTEAAWTEAVPSEAVVAESSEPSESVSEEPKPEEPPKNSIWD